MSNGAKVALVTGGGQRVGRAVALSLARAGMDLAITYHRSVQQAMDVVDQIEDLGRKACAIQTDMAQPGAPDRIRQVFLKHFDRLDALVNNASVFEPSTLGEISQERFERDMAVNALVPLMLIQAFAEMLGAHYDPKMLASSGRVVNFVDAHVLGEPLPNYVSYSASKAALVEITATCALALAPKVAVNALAPGVVAWAGHYTEAMQARYLDRVPLARAGTPEDAAAATLFLIRDAHYCTGQTIRIDGGRFLT